MVLNRVPQIYINIRTLMRNNPTMRCTLGLDTKTDGVFITDVMIDWIDKMILYCDNTYYSRMRVHKIVEEMNKFELTLKDVLQYYQYFIRANFLQKPAIDIATDRYKEIADKRTVEELKQLVGLKHKIDFESLGQRPMEIEDSSDDEDSFVGGDPKLGMDHVDKEPDGNAWEL
jgi:hypothetical protein